MPDLASRARSFAALGDPHRLAIAEALELDDLTPGELARLTRLDTNLLAHHLGILESAGIVVRRTSAGDRRKKYVSLTLDREQSILRAATVPDGTVAFVCTHNSARSQFAAARYEQRTGRPSASAGTHPSPAVHPGAIDAALGFGLDLSTRKTAGYDDLAPAAIVVSVCDRAREHGLPPHDRHFHWSIPDPADEASGVGFRQAFELLDDRLTRLIGAATPNRGR